MTIKNTGQVPKKGRLITGWHSFDHAFTNLAGEIGMPTYKIYELYGRQGVGKSTLCACLAARLDPKGTIEYGDIEGQDPEYIQNILSRQGFDGTVDWVSDEKDEFMLDKLAQLLQREETSACILDSVGAISPIAERESSSADANMGRRAKLLAVFTRKALFSLRMRESPAICFLLNHQLMAIGYIGIITPGGDTKNYLAGVKMRLKEKESYDDGSYILEIEVTKNRMGYTGKKALLFMLAGEGVHTGMTAVIDCISLKLAEKDRVVKMDGQSYGYMKDLIGYAGIHDPEPFMPFIDALRNYNAKSLLPNP